MCNEQIKKEFIRWINAGRPKVWYKRSNNSWGYVVGAPAWDYRDIYIVDDEQAELRKLQIDEPDTKFQAYTSFNNEPASWVECEPSWDIHCKYRVKLSEWYEDENAFGKPVWVCDSTMHWKIDIFKAYKEDAKFKYRCSCGNWEIAKPVKPKDCYDPKKRKKK